MSDNVVTVKNGECTCGSKTLKCEYDANATLTVTNHSFLLKEPDYSKMYFKFCFKDGETAKYRMDKDCHNLQQFLDRMNNFHELEKENKCLQEQLKEANEVIESLRTYDFTVDDENAEYYQVKWNVKAKRFYKNRKWGVK